jgi:hypothetical protein
MYVLSEIPPATHRNTMKTSEENIHNAMELRLTTSEAFKRGEKILKRMQKSDKKLTKLEAVHILSAALCQVAITVCEEGLVPDDQFENVASDFLSTFRCYYSLDVAAAVRVFEEMED